MKNNIIIFFCFLFVISYYSFSVQAYDIEVDGIFYNLDVTDKTVSVTSGDVKYEGEIVIPEYIRYANQDLTVVSIKDEAFYRCSNLISVIIPNSVTYIGKHAFSYCSSLVSIEIPNSVTSIGISTFSDCI